MATEPGVKLDSGKAPWHLLPFKALASVVDVLNYGARKYTPHGWRKVENQRERYFAAAMRHMVAWWSGEEIDPESGLPHLSHAICSLMFLLEVEQENG